MKARITLFSGTHRPDALTAHCLVEALDDLRKNGIEYEFAMMCGASILPAARNAAVTEFLKSDCTDLVMLDDDVGWQEGALTKLLRFPVDVVGGCYPLKQDPETFMVRWDYSKPYLVAQGGLLEMEAIPTGFLRMTRACLEKMIAAFPQLAYHDDVLKGETSYALFDFELKDHRYWGEDFVFCRRWREIGGQVWCDPEIRFMHAGRKAYYGHMGDWLRGRESYTDDAARYAVEGAA